MEKNYIEYRYKVEELFFAYLKDGDLELLIKNLYEIEDTIIQIAFNGVVDNKVLWFRFSNDDTLAATIGNINADLSMPSNHPNHEYMIECLELAIDLNGEIQIYFS